MLKWERKNPKKNKEGKEKADKKEKEPDNDDLGNIGLSPSKSLSNIDIHGEDGTYISHVNVDDVKRNYGTIHEYLKQRHGPGRYSVSVRGKHGEDTKHISIAGEETPSPWGETPTTPAGSSAGMDNNQLMGIYLGQQTEIARLKAELEASKNNVQQSVLGQIVPMAMEFIKTMMTNRPETNLAEVMTAATESLRTLSEIRMPGDKSDDVGGLMGGIAQLIQGFQQQRQQAQTPVYMPSPTYPTQTPLNPPLSGGSQVVQPPAPPISQPAPPISQPAPQVSNQTATIENNGSATDVFFENLIGMTEQKQSPNAVAKYLLQSIQKIPPQEIAKLDPQMQVLVQQLQANPVAAFDAICQFEPSLTADAKYTMEIRSELEKLVT